MISSHQKNKQNYHCLSSNGQNGSRNFKKFHFRVNFYWQTIFCDWRNINWDLFMYTRKWIKTSKYRSKINYFISVWSVFACFNPFLDENYDNINYYDWWIKRFEVSNHSGGYWVKWWYNLCTGVTVLFGMAWISYTVYKKSESRRPDSKKRFWPDRSK